MLILLARESKPVNNLSPKPEKANPEATRSQTTRWQPGLLTIQANGQSYIKSAQFPNTNTLTLLHSIDQCGPS